MSNGTLLRESETPMTEQERVWHSLWLYGIVIDDDQNLASLGRYWNPEQDMTLKPAYYVPDDEDTIVSLVNLDGPNRHDDPSLSEIAGWMAA